MDERGSLPRSLSTFSGFIKARERTNGRVRGVKKRGGKKGKNKQRKTRREENAEKKTGTTREANETEKERRIGQPTHEHQPCLGLHHP